MTNRRKSPHTGRILAKVNRQLNRLNLQLVRDLPVNQMMKIYSLWLTNRPVESFVVNLLHFSDGMIKRKMNHVYRFSMFSRNSNAVYTVLRSVV
jgi:hypothetical protein